MTNQTTLARDILKSLDMDAILDLTVDQIADVAERQLFPTAQYQLNCIDATVEAGTESSGAYVLVKFEVAAVIELASPEDADQEPEVGAPFSVRYYPGYGIENFKTTFSDLVEELKAALGVEPTVRQILEALPATSWHTLIEYRTRKDKETQEVKAFNEMNTHMTSLIGATE